MKGAPKSIRIIKDFPKKGIAFYDIATILANPKEFNKIVNKMTMEVKKLRANTIVGIDSRGFIFAAAVAYKLKLKLVMIRKKGKLPAETHSVEFELEYGKATMEIHKDSITQNDSVLLIDDLIATGGTAEAAAKLVEISGGKVAGFVFVINLFDLNGVKKLKDKGYISNCLLDFPGH